MTTGDLAPSLPRPGVPGGGATALRSDRPRHRGFAASSSERRPSRLGANEPPGSLPRLRSLRAGRPSDTRRHPRRGASGVRTPVIRRRSALDLAMVGVELGPVVRAEAMGAAGRDARTSRSAPYGVDSGTFGEIWSDRRGLADYQPGHLPYPAPAFLSSWIARRALPACDPGPPPYPDAVRASSSSSRPSRPRVPPVLPPPPPQRAWFGSEPASADPRPVAAAGDPAARGGTDRAARQAGRP